MERKVFIIRHAKSSWANPGQADFERPLNERGEHDAPMMGELLQSKGIMPDLIISSPAKRAKQTARRIAGAMKYDKDNISYVESLYHAPPQVIEEVIYGVEDKHKVIFIVAHNPGITDFVNDISGFKTANVPTCGITGISLQAASWSDYPLVKKEVFLFEYPKKYYDNK